MAHALASQLTQRFFRYLAITSQSDPKVKTLPSTPGQHEMARALAMELQTLGLDDIVIDEFATVTAVKRAMCPAHRASVLSPISIPSTWDCHRIFIRRSSRLPEMISV